MNLENMLPADRLTLAKIELFFYQSCPASIRTTLTAIKLENFKQAAPNVYTLAYNGTPVAVITNVIDNTPIKSYNLNQVHSFPYSL